MKMPEINSIMGNTLNSARTWAGVIVSRPAVLVAPRPGLFSFARTGCP